MSLRIRHLLLKVLTEKGPFGARVKFDDGLNVVRAENSHGKSTCMQSIIYGLGLEGMFSGSHEIPLTPAVTQEVDAPVGLLPVLSSEVLLEIENAQGQRITCQRTIKGERDHRLVSVHFGPALSDPNGSYKTQDFYVRLGGGFANPAGFHGELTRFMGWTLPKVPRVNGQETLLYPECIFPLLYVEQKKGYGAIEGRFPTHLGVRDVGSRSVEFLLKLDVTELAARRAALEDVERTLREKWNAQVSLIESIAKEVGGLVRNLSRKPQGDWPPEVKPTVVLSQGQEWVELSQEIQSVSEELASLSQEDIPRVENVTLQSREALNAAQNALFDLERSVSEQTRSIDAERGELVSVRKRLAAIAEDLTRNQDAKRLEGLGSVSGWSVSKDSCPVCHQDVGAALLSGDATVRPMSVDQNIAFLLEQRKIFEFMYAQAEQSIAARQVQIQASNTKLDDIRAEIRSLKKTLVSDARVPSFAAIDQRVRLDHRVNSLISVQHRIGDHLNAFAELSSAWRDYQAEIANLPPGELSATDNAKLDYLETSLVEQLVEYDMKSVVPKTVHISKASYRPTHEGFDLQFDLSASDTIRTIWAYRVGLLETGAAFATNHPGVLMFDEPEQQRVSHESFQAFLRRLTRTLTSNQQAIIATSQARQQVVSDLDGLTYSLSHFGGRVVSPL